MPSRNKKHKREDWISIVITIAFILGFLVLANSGSLITGFTTVEPVTTMDFEVNSVIPSTAILEIESGIQIVQQNLSEFTIALSDLQNIKPLYEQEKLVAYNITNLTIDLASYNIQPAESITIRFMEIYKEITRESVTKRITKEETITEEIVAITKENITEFTLAEVTENITEFAIQPEENITEFETEEVKFRTQALGDILIENWDDGDDTTPEWTDSAAVFAPSTAQAHTASYSELFDGNTDGTPGLLTKVDAINLAGKTNGNASYWAWGDVALDAGEYCCLDLSPDGTNWNNGIFGTMDCAEGQSGVGVNEGNWISRSRELNSSYYNANFKIRFRCDSNKAGEVWYIDDINVSADTPVVDITAPIVNLQFPFNNTNSSSAYVNFTYNATDADNGVDVCRLWLQKAGTWELNKTDIDIEETINNTLNITIEDNLNVLWRVECNDTSTNQDNKANSTTYNITININDPPIVNINFPENNTRSAVHSVNFTYNVTDADINSYGEIKNCSLLIQNANGWQVNKSNATAITETVNQTINITLGHENINWTVQCEDEGGLKANATIYNYTVYDTTPSPTLVSPANNTNSLSHSANFTYQVTGLDSVINCTLLIQNANGWQPNKSNATAIIEGVDQTINITLGHENINWTIQCESSYNEKANATIYNYTVYDAIPTVSLVFPENNTYQDGSYYVNFTYNVTGRDTYTCDLYINNELNSTDTNIEKAVNQTFNISFDSYQNINWSVGCNSTYNDYLNSTMYNYSLLEQQNQPPTIPLSNITQIGSTSIILDDKKQVSFTFAACDPDGNENIQQGFANMTGEDDFFDANLSCTATAWTNTTCKQFNCTFDFWYFYKAGLWNYSMNVTDGTEWAHANASTFQLGETTGVVITPTYTSWSTIYSGQWNKTADDDPITINNTGNYNISLNKVNVTAYNLRGEQTQTEEIPAANFTVSINTDVNNIECIGTAMANATSIDITNSMLPRGNHSLGIAQEQLYLCLVHIPLNIENQEYSTQNSYQWKIGVS